MKAWMGTVLRHVLLLQKDLHKAARFYNEGLELPILVLSDRWAELGSGPSKIALKAVEGYNFHALHVMFCLHNSLPMRRLGNYGAM